MRIVSAHVLALLAVLLMFSPARADLYYASATPGTPGQTSGTSIIPSQFVGARFEVVYPVTIDHIGGHLRRIPGGNQLIFGCIVALSSMTDFPDSLNLTTPDVLTVVTFSPPAPSDEVIVPITPLELSPGTYGVLFGTNLFGATGQGSLPHGGSTQIGPETNFWTDSVPQWREQNLGAPVRLTVYSVPEPSVPALLLIACPALLRRKERSQGNID